MPGRSIAANRCRKRRVAAEISAAGSLEFIESSLCRWTRLEGRPVDRLNEGLVWRKHFLERERELRRAVRLEMRETLFGLVHARKTALRHPPQGDVGAGEFFEPGLPLPQHLDVRAVVHVALQLLDRFPDRQVEQDTIVTVGTKVGGVAVGGLQTPDEAGAAVGERVDLLQPGDETRHHGILERRFHPGDVDLGDVQMGHGLLPIYRHFSLMAAALQDLSGEEVVDLTVTRNGGGSRRPGARRLLCGIAQVLLGCRLCPQFSESSVTQFLLHSFSELVRFTKDTPGPSLLWSFALVVHVIGRSRAA